MELLNLLALLLQKIEPPRPALRGEETRCRLKELLSASRAECHDRGLCPDDPPRRRRGRIPTNTSYYCSLLWLLQLTLPRQHTTTHHGHTGGG